MSNTEIINESREPKIGVFWVNGQEIIEWSMPAHSVPPDSMGFRDSPSEWDHANLWDKVVNSHPQFENKEYYDIPRGRVIYSDKEGAFRIVSNKAIISNKTIIAKIQRLYSLPVKVKLIADAHYEKEPALANYFDLEGD